MSQFQRKLNYRFAPKDARDLKYAEHLGGGMHALSAPLPTHVDLRPKMPPIYDQGQEGSCTAHAGAAHREYLDMLIGKPRVVVSRQFIYACERLKDGTFSQDAGASMRDICDVLLASGVCAETLWPYTSADEFKVPTTACYTDAKNHKIGSYYAVTTGMDMKHCLAAGYPFVFGINVPEVMMGNQVAQSGVLPALDPSRDKVIGGHALLCVGYDSVKKIYIVRNSWGTDWGQHGYFMIPASVMEDQNWVSDCYTMRLASVKK